MENFKVEKNIAIKILERVDAFVNLAETFILVGLMPYAQKLVRMQLTMFIP